MIGNKLVTMDLAT